MKCKRSLQVVLALYAGVLLFIDVQGTPGTMPPLKYDSSNCIAVWVYFSSKSGGEAYTGIVSPHALARRRSAGYAGSEESDRAISSKYVHEIEALGAKYRHCFKWENAASFDLPAAVLPAVKALPCVSRVTFVGKYRRKIEKPRVQMLKRHTLIYGNYGKAFDPLAMLNIPRTHHYSEHMFQGAPPGTGVRLAFFDSGFRLDHRCFRHLHERNAIKGVYDFVDRDTTVADPDSVASDMSHPLWTNDFHGTQVLSLVAAYDPPYFCGSAWGVDILLARTEDTYVDLKTGLEHELHSEEDNWAAAVVWAESCGVDIISSSLGYRYDFQDSITITRSDGATVRILDYLKSDLDGQTTIVSRAARGAVERGIIIVNAAGNEGSTDGDTSLSAPADVEGVIAVGAVNNDGTRSYFSSLGPNADGWLKPDVVAPGQGICLPDVGHPDNSDYLGSSSGTSFSTPFISGICALIQQMFPDYTAEQVKEKLFSYCRFLPKQTNVDNAYGRGIPDALLSCMRWHDEVFLTAMDTGGHPLDKAYIADEHGDTLGSTGTDGIVSFRIGGEEPAVIHLLHGSRRRMVTIDSTPCWKDVVPCSLVIKVFNEENEPLPFVTARFQTGSKERTVHGDSLGKVVFNDFIPSPTVFFLSMPGYVRSDTIHAVLGEQLTVQTVVLKKTQRPFFEAYPTVIRRRHGNNVLILRFATETGNPVYGARACASIRSLGGTLVWKKDTLTDGTPVTLHWNCKSPGGIRTAPGVYFLMFNCEGKNYRRKIIIAE